MKYGEMQKLQIVWIPIEIDKNNRRRNATTAIFHVFFFRKVMPFSFYTSCMYTELGVDRLSALILSIFTIIDFGHFQNRFADNFFFLLCKQTYYLQVTLFIGE